MVFASPWVQESTENRKEIAPGKHMPKKCENLGAEAKKNMKMGVTILCHQGVGNSLVSDQEAFRLHFGPQVVSRPHLGAN